MDNSQNTTIQYCFPNNGSSCRKEVRTGTAYMFLIIILSCISVCTVFLNLLVIISISHFKQFHTPTNLLILSLSVADLLVGLFVMPMNIMQLADSCFYLGKIACCIFPGITFIATAGSICSLTFIAVDRYIAINYPLHYSTTITVCKMSIAIILGWAFCLLYVIMYMYFNDHLLPSQISTTCYGECVLFIKPSWIFIDMLFFFIAPCSVILILYSIIFYVAKRQAKAIRAVTNGVSHKRRVKASSESKATKTLGIVIFIYLTCYVPSYLGSLTVERFTSVSMVWIVFGWVMYINSAVNPLIYAIFYPWFRKSAKYIVTCKIFLSSKMNLYVRH